MCFAYMVAGDRGVASQLSRRTHETWRQEAKKSDAYLKEYLFVPVSLLWYDSVLKDVIVAHDGNPAYCIQMVCYSGKFIFLAALIIGELEMFRNDWRNNEHFRYHSTIKIMYVIHTQCISINVSRYVWRFLDHFHIPLPNDQQAHPPKRDVACIHCRGRIVVRRWQD